MHTGGAQNLVFRLTISVVCAAVPARGEDTLAHSSGEAMSLLRCDFNLLPTHVQVQSHRDSLFAFS